MAQEDVIESDVKPQDHVPAAPVAHPHIKLESMSKAALPPTEIAREGNLLRLDYESFIIWLDCEKWGAVKCRYNAQDHHGNKPRYNSF